jgi:XTP/dITP diphosphohydrolase
MRLVLASANPDKAAEIAVILEPLGFELEPRPDSVPDVAEDGDTLEDNARLKAVAICVATGAAAVADDTGLEVDALGGAPGVRTARFAGENATYADNVTALLDALVEVSDPALRAARFRSVAFVRFPDGREVAAEGVVAGRIAFAPIGTNGFGYDPVFIPDGGDGRTLAQLPQAGKNAISHRGRAFRALAAKLMSSNPAN